jgi:hypothetical protein
MATGFQGSTDNNVHVIQLIAGALAANTVTLDPAVFAAAPAVTEFFDFGGALPPSFDIVIRSTAGSGVMTLAASRVLVADKASAVGGPLGVGADATKGMLNNGAGFGETGANVIYHRETIDYDLNHCDGIQVQLGAIAGTDTAIRVELIFPRIWNRA